MVLTGTGVAPMGTRMGPGSPFCYGDADRDRPNRDTDGRRAGGAAWGWVQRGRAPGAARPALTGGRAGSGAGTGTGAGAGAGGQEAGRRYGAVPSRERAGAQEVSGAPRLRTAARRARGQGHEKGAGPAGWGVVTRGAWSVRGRGQ